MKSEDLSANRFVLDARAAADLRARFKQDPQAGLHQAAQQFESMLLQMMLKSMREAVPQDGLFDSDQTRFYTSILDQQLAQNLSAKGSLGFARLIEQQLGRNLSSGEGSDAALMRLQQAMAERQAASSAASLAGGAERNRGLSASSAAAAATEASGVAESGRDFVNRVWPHALDAARTLGVPPHFLVAHSALETGWGKSEIRMPDGSPTYNVFGIKAGRNWNGASVEVPTTEYVDGAARSVKEKFRVYGSYAEAFRDYAALLSGNARFSGVLGQQDGTRFARSLQQAGYATDPGYADKLGRIIGGAVLRQALAG